MGQTRLDSIIASNCCLASSCFASEELSDLKQVCLQDSLMLMIILPQGAGIHLLECLYNLTAPPALPAEHFSVCHSDINVTQTSVDVSDSPLESPIFFLSA